MLLDIYVHKKAARPCLSWRACLHVAAPKRGQMLQKGPNDVREWCIFLFIPQPVQNSPERLLGLVPGSPRLPRFNEPPGPALHTRPQPWLPRPCLRPQPRPGPGPDPSPDRTLDASLWAPSLWTLSPVTPTPITLHRGKWQVLRHGWAAEARAEPRRGEAHYEPQSVLLLECYYLKPSCDVFSQHTLIVLWGCHLLSSDSLHVNKHIIF